MLGNFGHCWDQPWEIRGPKFEEIRNFNNKLDKLFIIKRKRPESSNIFFKKLIKTSFTVIGEITKENALENIRSILECEI